MGVDDDWEVRLMGGMAKYEIAKERESLTARYFIRPCDAAALTPFEIEVREVIRNGYEKMDDVVAGRVDPFKAAESILAEHYGSARMVEADYEWRPRIRY
ncbi:hypothetical protein [Slackia isoflavoniconvertens]|uniref:hypothetical protein n=1 Tax=Slackia isoflavoniconvertens TaxID=572010 RepID=UPI003AB920DE